jgi:adenylate kinase
MQPNIHLLGIQGSGKGTQASRLVEAYQLDYLGSGNLLRARSEVHDAVGHELQQELRRGKLVPDSYLVTTISDYLDAHPDLRGIIGDGVIRTTKQEELLTPIWEQHTLDLPLLIHLELSEEVAQERIATRKRQAESGENAAHHQTFSGKLLKRNDDNPLAIHERFRIFHSMTTPVIEVFEQKKRCIHISAEDSIEKIFSNIILAVKKFYPDIESHVTT